MEAREWVFFIQQAESASECLKELQVICSVACASSAGLICRYLYVHSMWISSECIRISLGPTGWGLGLPSCDTRMVALSHTHLHKQHSAINYIKYCHRRDATDAGSEPRDGGESSGMHGRWAAPR